MLNIVLGINNCTQLYTGAHALGGEDECQQIKCNSCGHLYKDNFTQRLLHLISMIISNMQQLISSWRIQLVK
jgi:uncharacterized Zn finger protein